MFLYAISISIVVSSVTALSVFARSNSTSDSDNNKFLSILSNTSFVDKGGALHVVGEVENNSPSATEFVKVIGTFYDSSGKVVGTDFAYTKPDKLPVGEKAPFELILMSASIPVKEIHNYKLTLDWQKQEEAAIAGIPNDIKLDDIVISNQSFAEQTGSDIVHCGEKVRGTIILTANINCSTHGLIIGNNTIVNMNGYSITGP